MSETSDRDLLEAWRAGDTTAGTTLFERHFAAVARFFRTKVPEAAEDLVQQTFLASVEGQRRLRDAEGFRGYLFGIARNLLHAHIRRRHRDGDKVDFVTSSIQELGPGPSTFVGHRREQRLMLEALRRIPLDLQIALELFYWEDMEAKDIAHTLEIPEGTVRSRLRRARQLLKERLQGLAKPGERLETTETVLADWARQLKDVVDHDDP